MKFITAIAAFLIMILSISVWAISSYKNSFNSLYGTTGTILDQCWTCHVRGQSYSQLNPYGSDLSDALAQSSNFIEALRAIEEIDSDGDGDTNIVEITAGTLPGDENSSTPTSNATWGTIKNYYKK